MQRTPGDTDSINAGGLERTSLPVVSYAEPASIGFDAGLSRGWVALCSALVSCGSVASVALYDSWPPVRSLFPLNVVVWFLATSVGAIASTLAMMEGTTRRLGLLAIVFHGLAAAWLLITYAAD